MLTHCNSINLGMICFVVVSVEGFLSNGKRSANRVRIVVIFDCVREVGVDMVHGGYYGTDTWGATRKKKGRIFENLQAD